MIEVLAATAIAAVLLSAVTVSRARLTRQWNAADRRLTAIAAAERLLEDWYDPRQMKLSVPPEATGGIDASPALYWRTTTIAVSESLVCKIVRLSISEAGDEQNPLLELDLLVPIETELPPGEGEMRGR